ncbi:hypothetical protein [Paraburkholderia sp. DHOC27]|uniref:hypothetical protein n=1 Tax=Paraburkholderia sp. DHOC27 TaxID=2303330 RepID=UPI0011C11EDF|nr:hypothetical protein [Paraburkholderia sp. DHOC27]
MRWIVLTVVVALTISRAFACSGPESQRGQTRDINFDFNSSTISNTEVLALANWIVDSRINLSALEGTSIVGLADMREHDPQRIAQRRAETVKQALDMLQVRSATTEVVAHVYQPMMPDSKYEPTGTRVEVTLIPACSDK